MNGDIGDKWLTINEVAAVTRRSRQWVYDRIHDGTFEANGLGARHWKTYVSRSVRVWLEAQVDDHEKRLRHYYDQLEEVLV
jgi:predicted DNA-binding transcriptional regulator AlpA